MPHSCLDRVSYAAQVQSACQALVDSENHLTDLDRIVGDGDCGATFRRAAAAVMDSGSLNIAEPDRLCSGIGDIIREVMGGSSGAIMDIMLHAAAASLRSFPIYAGAFAA